MKAQSVHNQAQRKAFLGPLPFKERFPKLVAMSGARWLHSFLNFSSNPYFRHTFARMVFAPLGEKSASERALCWLDERRNKIDRRTCAYFDLDVAGEKPSGNSIARAVELLNECARWAKSRGVTELVGPLSLREFGALEEFSGANSEVLFEALQKIGKTQSERHIALDWHPARAISEEERLQLEKKKLVGELRFVDFDPARATSAQLQSALAVLAQNDQRVFFDEGEWRAILGIENAFARPSRNQPLGFLVEVDRQVIAACWAYQDFRGRAVTLWSECLAEFRPSGVERWMDVELMRRAKALGFEKVRTPWVNESDERRIDRFQSLGATLGAETSLFTTRLV